MLTLVFIILRLLNVINTRYDWGLLALFLIADGVWRTHGVINEVKEALANAR